MALYKEYFIYLGTNDAKCKLCDLAVSRTGGNTTSMKKHLEKSHPTEFKNVKEGEIAKAQKRQSEKSR